MPFYCHRKGKYEVYMYSKVIVKLNLVRLTRYLDLKVLYLDFKVLLKIVQYDYNYKNHKQIYVTIVVLCFHTSSRLAR